MILLCIMMLSMIVISLKPTNIIICNCQHIIRPGHHLPLGDIRQLETLLCTDNYLFCSSYVHATVVYTDSEPRIVEENVSEY